MLDVDSRELDKQNAKLLSISVWITTEFLAHTIVSPYGRSLINICWLNKQMKDVFVTWSGKQFNCSSLSTRVAGWKVFRKLLLAVVIPDDTREIIIWRCWWNHFCWRLLLDSAIFWTSHHLCFQMQKKSNITNTINWINLTFMPYDILLSYHSICIIHQ